MYIDCKILMKISNEQELMMGRAIFINKTYGYNSIFVEQKILVFVLFFLNMIKQLFLVFVYTCHEINSNTYDYKEVLSAIYMLQLLYTPHYIICGGDWITYFTKKRHFSLNRLFFVVIT